MAGERVRYTLRDTVAVITLDDGKANALGHETIASLNEFLDRAEREALAVLIVGREGRLSGGFDLSVMTSGAENVRSLVTAGAELMVRIYSFPRPVVVACTGHALAAGAIFLLVADVRIGAKGNFKIGFNEVSIQMPLPIFALEFARDRLSKRHFTAATTQARVFNPETAKDAGFLDSSEEPSMLSEVAFEHARRLADLPDPAFRNTKQRERAASVKLIRETLAKDMESFARQG